MALTVDSTDRLAMRTVSGEMVSKARICWSFSPSALRMWDSAACCSATDSNTSVMAWRRREGAAVVVELEVVVDVVEVVLEVVVVVLEVVEVVLEVDEVVLEVVEVVLEVDEVVLDVVEVVLEVVLEVGLVVSRQTVGSGSSPVKSSLWLSALPE